MKKKFLYLLFAISLLSSSVAFAGTSGNNTDIKNNKQFNNENRDKKPENEVIGKITSISENSITVTIAERKQLDFKNNKKPDNKNNNDNSKNDSVKPEFNPDDMFNLTNETKTYDISSAKLLAGRNFGNAKNNNNNKNDNNTAREKPTEEEIKYTDFKTGDYVMIELESSTSTKAKTVRNATGRFGGGRDGMRPDNSKKDDMKKQ